MPGAPANPADPAATCSRRDALRMPFVAFAAPALAPLAALAGCAKAPEPPAGTVVELSTLPEGEHVVVMHGEEPVELVRTGTGVRARSLWCTHMGCRVRWDAAESVYTCPCHAGIFDADGRPIEGPPTVPLRTTTLAIDSGRVVIPPRAPHEASPSLRPVLPAPKGNPV